MNQVLNEKQELPSNLDAEKVVLGSMLLDEDAILQSYDKLKEDDFYFFSNKIIFRAIIDLFKAERTVNPIILEDYLKTANVFEKVGGIQYINSLCDVSVVSTSHEAYIEFVLEKSMLRQLIKVTKELNTLAYSNMNAKEIIEKAEAEIFRISADRRERDFVEIQEVIKENLEKIKSLDASSTQITGVNTGLGSLNTKLNGFQKSDLILLAARPSMGKTAMGLNFCKTVAVDQGGTVAIFSLEMPKNHLVNRMLASQALVDLSNLFSGDLSDQDYESIRVAIESYSRGKIYIDDTPNISIHELRSKLRKLKSKCNNIDLICIDYLQLMRGDGENRQQEIASISRGLKAVAREMGAPIIALSQLSREVEKRSNNRPILSDMRESGAIEQDADVVMLLFREAYYQANDMNKTIDPAILNTAELIIAKHRNGETGSLFLHWKPEFQLFSDIASPSAHAAGLGG